MEIEKKLLKIQQELKAPKSQRNTFGNYNYRSCEDILEAVKPLLKKNNVVLNLTDTIENIGDRYYVKATVILADTETEETLEVTSYAKEPETKKGMDEAQITGATSSYARKYALNGLFAIDDTKDADIMDNTKPTDKKIETKATPKQIEIISKKYSPTELAKTFSCEIPDVEEKLKKLTVKQASQLIERK